MEKHLNKDEINNSTKPKDVGDLMADTKEKVDLCINSGVDDKKSPLGYIDDIKKTIRVSPQEFQNSILKEIGHTQPLTNGMEGEIYKIKYKGSNYIVAKKRFDLGSLNEYKIHNDAFKISKSSNTGVKVPVPLFEFNDGKNGFVIMEFIEGQTLYTMIWEEIVNKFIIPRIKKLLSSQDSKRFQYFEEGFIENNRVKFDNDTQTEELVMELAEILYELGDIKEYPRVSERDSNKPHIKKYPVLEQIYKKYLKKINIFGDNVGDKVHNKLNEFLQEIHSEGIYHRDLGGNPRNIMFNRVGDDIETTIIDFGMGTNLGKGAKCDYINNVSGGIYDNDNFILPQIKALTGEYDSEDIVDEQDINIDEIISNGLRVGINLNPREVESFINLSNHINLNKVLDDFVIGNDRMYDWFIYLNKSLDSYSESSSVKGYNKIFVLIQLLDINKKEKLQEKVNELLKNKKNTKKYKYGKLFDEYLNI